MGKDPFAKARPPQTSLRNQKSELEQCFVIGTTNRAGTSYQTTWMPDAKRVGSPESGRKGLGHHAQG